MPRILCLTAVSPILAISACFDFTAKDFACSEDASICAPGTACVDDACLPLCVSTSNCGENSTLACVQGVCREFVGPCSGSDTQCPDEWFCNSDNACQRRLTDGALCSEGRMCRSMSCEGGTCALPECGDNIIQDGEECDDGNAIDDGNGCSMDCARPGFCGDGVIESLFELCDDGNTDGGDYCSADCQATTGSCGDGVQQSVEDCDDGNQINDGDGCSAECQRLGSCGDLAVQSAFEECDDGNSLNGDYCSADCQTITGTCGDGVLQSNEGCDDGNAVDDGNGCDGNCQRDGFCGNGVIEAAFEECDDGSNDPDDGCDQLCTIEDGWFCDATGCELRVIFVDAAAPGGGDGSSWVSAYADLADALASAADGDEIWLASGLYLPLNATTPSEGFEVSEDVEIRGGFAGTESLPSDRGVGTPPSVLSGDLNGDDGPAFANMVDNSNAVIRYTSDVGTGLIENVTITASSGSSADHAGLVVEVAFMAIPEVTLRDSIVTTTNSRGVSAYGHLTVDNSTFLDINGIAIYEFPSPSSRIDVYDTQISNAQIGFLVSGIVSDSSVSNCQTGALAGSFYRTTFDGNVVGAQNVGSIVGCVFSNNSETAVRIEARSVTIVDSLFVNNSGPVGGALELISPTECPCCMSPPCGICGCGEVAVAGTTTQISTSRFVGNSATDGGAVWCDDLAVVSIDNSLLSGNVASSDGGGFFGVGQCTLSAHSSTFSNNVATFSGQSVNGGVLTMRNSIVWGNSSAHIENVDGASTVEYSNVIGGYTGTGNTSIDPMFVDPNGADDTLGTADDNARLQSTSPLIDAGSNSSLPMDIADVDNDLDTTELLPLDADRAPRQCDVSTIADTGEGSAPIVDMGAYEVCI